MPIDRRIQRLHARKRFLERYGEPLGEYLYGLMAARVWAFINSGVEPCGVERVWAWGPDYFVAYRDRHVIAVWDERSQQIGTFLPVAEAWPRAASDSFGR